MGDTGPSWHLWATAGVTAGFLGVQVLHTVRDRNRWPFCAYNMFNYRLGDRSTQLRVILATDRGYLHGPDDPWGLLPVESFRIDSLMRLMFDGNTPLPAKDIFCERVLVRLNESRWPKWDEIRGSFYLPEGHRFVALAIYLVGINFTFNDPHDRAHVSWTKLLHRFDPACVLPSVTGIPGGWDV